MDCTVPIANSFQALLEREVPERREDMGMESISQMAKIFSWNVRGMNSPTK